MYTYQNGTVTDSVVYGTALSSGQRDVVQHNDCAFMDVRPVFYVKIWLKKNEPAALWKLSIRTCLPYFTERKALLPGLVLCDLIPSSSFPHPMWVCPKKAVDPRKLEPDFGDAP